MERTYLRTALAIVSARLGYDFSTHLGIFVQTDYEKMISGCGAEDEYNTATGVTRHIDGAIGGEFQVLNLKAGLNGNF